MSNKFYVACQIIVMVLMVASLILTLILFSYHRDRMTLIEQRQDVLAPRLEVIRSEGGYP
jgi:hypothetical protein